MESEPGSSFLFEHDLFRKPVPTPDQVRGRLFRDHALAFCLSMIFSENRFPPRIKSEAGFFGIMLWRDGERR
jgi:hypothetical protein